MTFCHLLEVFLVIAAFNFQLEISISIQYYIFCYFICSITRFEFQKHNELSEQINIIIL